MSALVLLLSCWLLSGAPSAPEEITFPTSDGGVVGALRYGAGDHVVVLVHGGRFSKESWEDQARALADSGLQVLAVDLRGRNRSHGGDEPGAERWIQLDVLAAVGYARQKGAEKVSLVGASLGGWAVGQAAVEAPEGVLDAVVLIAASPVQEPERMQGRKLFVVAEEDRTPTGRLRLDTVRNQYERASEPKELVVLPGGAHAQYLFDSDQGPRLMQLLVDFLTAD